MEIGGDIEGGGKGTQPLLALAPAVNDGSDGGLVDGGCLAVVAVATSRH
jgi:hypothetical protein